MSRAKPLWTEFIGVVREALAPRGSKVAEFPYDLPRRGVLSPTSARAGCQICFNSCTTRVYLEDGKPVAVTGNEADPATRGRLCPKGQFLLQMRYNRFRLTHPLKRAGERGSGKFHRIGWDEGLEELAAALKQVREAYGPEALAIFTGTRSGLLAGHGTAVLFRDLFGTPNHSSTNPYCATGADQAFLMTQGTAMGSSGNAYTEGDLGSADYYLFIGDNMAETRPVHFGFLNDCRLRRGAKMVVVDPRQTATASKADGWIPIRPGTDMALALAMVHHIITKGLTDVSFVEDWVEGFDRIREFILRRGYTPAWASLITDIPATTIERLAEEYAGVSRAVIFACRGVTQHSNSVQTSRALMILAAATGHWGKEGSGLMMVSGTLPIGAQSLPSTWRPDRGPIRRSPAGWLEAMRTGRPYPIKALVMTGNPLSLWPDQRAVREAFKQLEVIAHLELFQNEAGAYADYVFPMASGIEAGDVNRIAEDRRVVWIEKLIDPPGEAKPDYWFWVELGKRLGFGDVLKEAYKDPAVLWDEIMISNPLVRGMTVARLRRDPRGWVRGPLPAAGSPEIETLFLEGATFPGVPAGTRFPTPSGKLELWTEAIEKRFSALGLSAMPEFYAEPEGLVALPHLEYLAGDGEEGVVSPFWPDGAWTRPVRIVVPGTRERSDYDTELVTGRPGAVHFHSWTHWLWQAQEICPDLFVHMHPEKAAACGILSGDRVIIESPRGSIEAVARVDPGIRRTAVFVPLGWGEKQPFHPWKPVNWLLPADQRCPISDQTNLKMTLCRIRKR